MQDKLSKIRKQMATILAKAEDAGSSDAEKQVMMDKFIELSTKYQIDRKDITVEETTERIDVSGITYGRSPVFMKNKSKHEWQKAIMRFLCDFFPSVQWYMDTSEHQITNPEGEAPNLFMKEWGKPFWFYGPVDDSIAAAKMFYDIEQVVIACCLKQYSSVSKQDGRSYCEGFVQGMAARAADAKKRIEGEMKHEIILINDKALTLIQERSRDELAEKFGVKLQTRRGSARRVTSNPHARMKGYEDGKKFSPEQRKGQGKLKG